MSFRITTTVAVLLITVFLDVKFHNGSTIRVMGLQWRSNYLWICIIILIGWDLHYVLFFHFVIIQVTFIWSWNQIFLITSVFFWRPYLGVVGPLLSSSITEDNKLISLYGHSFIWVSFIPCGLISHQWGLLSHQWSQCTCIEFLFCHSPDLSLLKCGVNLVYQHSIKEFTHIIAQCITSYGDYLHFSNYNEIGGTNNSHDHVHHQRLPISQGELSEDPQPPNQFHRSGPLVKIL